MIGHMSGRPTRTRLGWHKVGPPRRVSILVGELGQVFGVPPMLAPNDAEEVAYASPAEVERLVEEARTAAVAERDVEIARLREILAHTLAALTDAPASSTRTYALERAQAYLDQLDPRGTAPVAKGVLPRSV